MIDVTTIQADLWADQGLDMGVGTSPTMGNERSTACDLGSYPAAGQDDSEADLVSKLNELSTEILLSDLRRFGNEPSAEQEVALRKVLSTYTEIALEGVSGRFAFPLPTGMGKTRSIVAWLWAVSTLGLSEVSCMVTASKVEALCRLKRDLVDAGVPEHEIGLVHSYKHDPDIAEAYLSGDRELPSGYASEPCTEDFENRPFLLLTHQRVKGPKGISEYIVYKGKSRSLVIWDESLLSSETFAFEDRRVRASFAWLTEMHQGKSPECDEALAYLRDATESIKQEVAIQQADPGRNPRTFTLTPLTEEDIERYKTALGTGEQAELLKDLLDISQEELRVLANVTQGGGVVTFRVSVPKELCNVVVLDASYPIRELAQLDSTIKQADIAKNIVSYENVTVYQLDNASGRGAMETEFSQKRGQNKVSREVAEVIKGIPQSEAILLFTFKGRGKLDYRKLLERDLEREGIDVNASVIVHGQRKPRLNFLTWGMETSLNQFSYCSNVILVGILHRSHIDIGGAIVGQAGDLLRPVTNGEIREVVQSEVAHVVYQALSRGACRVMKGRFASPMKAWLIHPEKENLKERLQQVLPGVNWVEWKGKYYLSKEAQRRAAAKTGTLAEVLKTYLGGLPLQITEVSTRQLKTNLQMKDVPARTFTRAMHEAAKATGWVLRGRTLVRAFEHYFGGDSEASRVCDRLQTLDPGWTPKGLLDPMPLVQLKGQALYKRNRLDMAAKS